MRLFASPWSAPAWMKTNGHMKGGGQLKGEFNGPYYKTYSKYFVRFFEEYFKEGVPFWGLTIENEPGAGLIADYEWQAMYLSNAMQKGFAEGLLGPAIRANPITQGLKIMAHDDQRDGIAVAAHEIYNKTTGPADYIDGLGVHWYSQSPFDTLTEAHNANPDKFILATEACTAYEKWEHAPILGHWERCEAYGHDIIQSILHWVTGWMDWNIALDEKGGPNWVGNNVDSPIIVNNTRDEFYKQPMFYYLGHFSKLVRPGSTRVHSSIVDGANLTSGYLEAVAFTTPKRQRILVLHNRHPNNTYEVALEDANIPGSATVTMEPKSISTLVWNKPSLRLASSFKRRA
ncbi:O-glycosyl hydrolase family 30 protein [Aphelenchoides avenae]|nr:O-glycosyl hydrolase family 30 protein [Aphelenchus avenae]